MDRPDHVWVFNGVGGRFPSGVFLDLDAAERWIAVHGLSGVLTAYPVDVGVYDWVIARGYWQPREPHQSGARFIGAFSSASLDHRHYEDGKRADEAGE